MRFSPLCGRLELHYFILFFVSVSWGKGQMFLFVEEVHLLIKMFPIH